jgi:hypothetical protein
MFRGRTILRIRKLKIGTLQSSKYVQYPNYLSECLLITFNIALAQPFNMALAQIDPNRRHVDKSVVAHFWKMLDSWIQMNKPSLVK